VADVYDPEPREDVRWRDVNFLERMDVRTMRSQLYR
jgi:hypothetical protein